MPIDEAAAYIENLLAEIQTNLFERAKQFRDYNITKVDNFDDFKEAVSGSGNAEIESWGGGFVSAHWDGTTETELKIKELTKATIRCIPLDNEKEEGQCVLTGKPSGQRVLFAKAY